MSLRMNLLFDRLCRIQPTLNIISQSNQIFFTRAFNQLYSLPLFFCSFASFDRFHLKRFIIEKNEEQL